MQLTRTIRTALAAAALLVAAGCVTLPWVPAEPAYTARRGDYSLELPPGWMRFNMDPDDDLILTRDGLPLQTILVERVKTDADLSNTKKKLAKGMMPLEAAEVVLDNIASDRRFASFEVLDNRPATVAGQPGFRATFLQKTRDDSLRVKTLYYGFLKGEVLYGFRYTAPARHYFDKDVGAFEKLLRSFKLTRRQA